MLSARNLTPSSTALVSPAKSAVPGAAVLGQMLHGHAAGVAVAVGLEVAVAGVVGVAVAVAARGTGVLVGVAVGGGLVLKTTSTQ
ncbi:MAG TPA: hypothetical protein VKA77_07555 [Mycobacterium sp.]|nr:hypothetical protein [Mycobacterium sp.]